MLFNDAQKIIKAALLAAQPHAAVVRALKDCDYGNGRVLLIAIGKAAFSMAKTACEIAGERITGGVVVTKYGHSMGHIGNLHIYEAGHPIPDENAITATQAAIDAVTGLTEHDLVLFLVSGGGSALFEKPLIPAEEMAAITKQLLDSGADIVEMNIVRKRLSAVKGGRFAKLCAPARVFSIVLSDIIGDPLDMIASGPAYPDSSTSAQAAAILKKYAIAATAQIDLLLREETPKSLDNVTTKVTGSVRQLCRSAYDECAALGYTPQILTDSLCCTARDAGSFLASIAKYHSGSARPLAFIAGGETVVKVTGNGMGGRNQEIALSAAAGIDGLKDVAIFSFGSDGTDGPTDAAGGYADGETSRKLMEKGIRIHKALDDNDAYHALKAVGGLLMTGPTGTNVNDLSVVLIKQSPS